MGAACGGGLGSAGGAAAAGGVGVGGVGAVGGAAAGVGVGVGVAAAAGAGAGAVAAAAVASSPACSSLGFFREAAVADDFSRGRRGARVGFSFSFSFSLSSFFLGRVSGVLVADVVVLLLESSSFLRRDRLATEARLDPTISSTGGPSSFDTPDSRVDMVVKKEQLIYN